MKKESNPYRRTYINGKMVKNHRIIMEIHLGRKLLSRELVHHKDGNIKNNKIQNLEIITKKEHEKTHSKDKRPRMSAEISKLAEYLRDQDLEKLGWRRVAVWAVYRDKATQLLNNI